MMQAASALLVMVAQILPGAWLASHISRRLRLGSAAFGALTPLLGLLLLAFVTLVAGHVGYLGPWLLWTLAMTGATLAIVERRCLASGVRDLVSSIGRHWRVSPVSVSAAVLSLTLALMASFAAPWRIDEVEYHWAAPVEWAEQRRWVASSYRHVDGFPLMEIAYTAAATVGSYAGAHLMHLSTLVALGFASVVGARALGLTGYGPVSAAAMIMPVVWDQAYVAYNDTAVGGFTVAAVAVILVNHERKSHLVLAMVLLAAAISIKPTALGAVGVVGLLILIKDWRERASTGGFRFTRVLARWLVLGFVALVTVGFWSVRRFLITGSWVDPQLAAPPSADELTRLPDTLDRLLAPVMPFALGVVGGQEPWGGRTSLVVAVFLLPAIAYVIWKRARIAEFVTTVVPAWVHWLVVGFAGVRTRFHLVSWTLLVLGVRVAVEDAARRYPRLQPWLAAAWAGAVLLGALDVSMEMVRVIRDRVL